MNLRLLKFSLAVVIALSSSGCQVVFTNSPAGRPERDKALFGRWISEEKENESGAVIFDRGSHDQVNVSFIPGDPEERNPVFTATITKPGNHSYLILNPTDKDRDKGFLIAKYEIKGDELVVWIPDSDKVKALINQEKISGEIRAPGAVVTGSPQNLSKFLQSKEGDETFVVFTKFRKAKR